MKDGILELADIRAAQQALGEELHRTPLISSRTLSTLCGCDLWLKAELFQKTGSFKARGLLYRLKRTTAEERERGFVSISAGNAAAAIAWAAARLGSTATIVMPESAVRSKVEATRAYGGEVILTAEDLLATSTEIGERRGLTFIHPFDDLDVMAGHGVAGLEILEDAPDLEAVVVPIGGGGLIGGIAAAIKAKRPAVELIGVEPAGAAAMSKSLASGRPEHLEQLDTVADGLAAPFAGEHTLRHVRALVDRIVIVDDETILDALKLLWTRCKLAAEPAGAAAVAALLAADETPSRRRVVAVVSGGNIDRDLVQRLLASPD